MISNATMFSSTFVRQEKLTNSINIFYFNMLFGIKKGLLWRCLNFVLNWRIFVFSCRLSDDCCYTSSLKTKKIVIESDLFLTESQITAFLDQSKE